VTAQSTLTIKALCTLTGCVPIAVSALVVTVPGMSYPSDLTDDQWELLQPIFNASRKRGRKHAADLRTVVDAMIYIAQTDCQWRYLPESFGPWTRAWSQFRRWSRNDTWARALTVPHAAAREADGRAEATPSMVIDTHQARSASNGGSTFHDRGGAVRPHEGCQAGGRRRRHRSARRGAGDAGLDARQRR
jgi:transposase